MLKIQIFTVNFIEENCYVLSDETREAVIVDCGAFFPEEREAIRQYVEKEGLTLRHHLLTHGHFDHIFGAQYVADTFGLLPQLGADDATTYEQAVQQMRAFIHRDMPLSLPPIGAKLNDGDVVNFGSHALRVINTPGHTPGGVCYYCEAEAILVSGDSLFRREIGRCDLPGGNEFQLINGLRQRILTLPEAVKVYPGHGPATTVGEEKTGNPYLR
ncbi:MAG: MBL fold metallo-hydrolase [Bacteroidales bacterium]|nr:MBL fold metallo-hydrolase [Bacteroidales bacterium]